MDDTKVVRRSTTYMYLVSEPRLESQIITSVLFSVNVWKLRRKGKTGAGEESNTNQIKDRTTEDPWSFSPGEGHSFPYSHCLKQCRTSCFTCHDLILGLLP